MTIQIKTYHKKEVIDITDKIGRELEGDGLLNVFIKHSTAAVSIADLDPGSDTDLLTALSKMTPIANWNHPHDPEHYPDHLWSSLIGCNLTIPYQSGRLALGEWQRVILIELDGPKDRELVLTSSK